jgi:iron complex outermembrane receptor protein
MNKTTMTAAILAALPLAASGQSGSTGQRVALEEVLVTATKRSESAQDVPVALSVVGTEVIDRLNIAGMSDLARVSPSISISQGDTKQNSNIRIRGIGTSVFSSGLEPSVLVMVDGVAQAQPGQAFSTLLDVQRMEVLRGPQSTLFGKNASAGAINVITRQASETFEGMVDLLGTNDGEYRAIASLSGPVSDTLRYRATAYYTEQDGYIKNLARDESYHDEEASGARVKLQWEPAERLSVDLVAAYSEDESACCVVTAWEVPENSTFFGFLPYDPSPVQPSEDNLAVAHDTPPSSETEESSLAATVQYEFGGFSLKSITAYSDWQYQASGDVDGTAVPLAQILTGGFMSGGLVNTTELDTELFSQELLLASPQDRAFDYLLGLYYAKSDTDRGFTRNISPANWQAGYTVETQAVFGQLGFALADDLRATLGVRYHHEDREAEFADAVRQLSLAGSESDSVVLGKASLQWEFAEDAMAYASYAKGYKGGGYDLTTGFDQEGLENPVGNESSDAWELGIKSQLFDGRAQINAALFYTMYDDYQAQRMDFDGTTFPVVGTLKIDNVGELKTQGIEVDAQALLTERLSVTASIAWIDATIESFPDAACYVGQVAGCRELAPGVFAQDLAGKDLPLSPDWKLSLSGEYRLPMNNMPFEGFVSATYLWQDEAMGTLTNNPRTVIPDYGVFNASIGIEERNAGAYRVSLFVNNAFDENYVTTLTDGRSALIAPYIIEGYHDRNSQRHVGLKLQLRF